MTDARPSFDEIYMGMAFMLARRSTCLRKSGVDGHPMYAKPYRTTTSLDIFQTVGINYRQLDTMPGWFHSAADAVREIA